MKPPILACAAIVLALTGSLVAQETPQTGAPAEWAMPMVEPQIFTFLQVDRLEGRTSDGEEGYLLDLQGWVGTDTSKFWGKIEGDGVVDGPLEALEVQALYSRIISPFFDLQIGLWQDITPNVSRTHAVVGVQGLVPYWFEADAAVFLSHTGDVTARLEAEYELLFSQRLVLQPRTEVKRGLPGDRGTRHRVRSVVGRGRAAPALRDPSRVGPLCWGVLAAGDRRHSRLCPGGGWSVGDDVVRGRASALVLSWKGVPMRVRLVLVAVVLVLVAAGVVTRRSGTERAARGLAG